MVLRHVVGSGAIESRSYGCVTLHAVGPGARSRTIMPHARGVDRRDATHLKRGGVVPPKKKTVALPVSPPANAAGGNSCLSMRRRLSPPGSRRQPVLPRSLRSARARSTACAPWPQWRSAVCARPTCRRSYFPAQNWIALAFGYNRLVCGKLQDRTDLG